MFARAFLQIARCPESQIKKVGNEIRLETSPFLIKYLDPRYKRELNRDILKYINYIKDLSLDYFKEFALRKAKVNRLMLFIL